MRPFVFAALSQLARQGADGTSRRASGEERWRCCGSSFRIDEEGSPIRQAHEQSLSAQREVVCFDHPMEIYVGGLRRAGLPEAWPMDDLLRRDMLTFV